MGFISDDDTKLKWTFKKFLCNFFFYPYNVNNFLLERKKKKNTESDNWKNFLFFSKMRKP